jgi:hypothetical protein
MVRCSFSNRSLQHPPLLEFTMLLGIEVNVRVIQQHASWVSLLSPLPSYIMPTR